jgi:internalin A
LESFNLPVKKDVLKDAEALLGQELPVEYKEFLSLHNGQDEFGPMVRGCALLPAEELKNIYDLAFISCDEVVSQEREDLRIKQANYSPDWIPIGHISGGTSFICLDMDPGEKGKKGQVIFFDSRAGDVEYLAEEFTTFLSLFFDELKNGEINLDL